MSKVNNGVDMVAQNLGRAVAGFTGTSTGTTATTMTDSGASFTASSGGPPQTGGLVGWVVVTGGVFGTILTSTSTVLTIDYWHTVTNPGGAAAGTPSTGTYVVLPAYPAAYFGLTTATRAIAGADAFLTNDGSTVSEIWNSSGGLNRALAAYAHTIGTSTYTLTKTFTSTAQDPASSTVHRVGVFTHNVTAAPTTTTTGIMFTETNLSSDAIITNNGSDQLTITWTGTIS